MERDIERRRSYDLWVPSHNRKKAKGEGNSLFERLGDLLLIEFE